MITTRYRIGRPPSPTVDYFIHEEFWAHLKPKIYNEVFMNRPSILSSLSFGSVKPTFYTILPLYSYIEDTTVFKTNRG